MTKKFNLISMLIILLLLIVPVSADVVDIPGARYNQITLFSPEIVIPVVILLYISLVNIFIVLSRHEHV